MQKLNDHFVLKHTLVPDVPGLQKCVFATGCFWGAEKGFWRLPGVFTTAVCYVGGNVENPSYEQVCSGKTGHTEGVFVAYDPTKVSFADLMVQFWMCHNPTQGNRQGNDRGTQYRSGIYYFNPEQKLLIDASKAAFQAVLTKNGHPEITTEIKPCDKFYYAEDYHQQYLAKPGSRQYCSAAPTNLPVPPIGEWTLSDELKSQHRATLALEFWQKYGPKSTCTINCPNEQIKWPL